MKTIGAKIKPKSGFAHIFHILLTILMPILIFVLVRIRFFQVAALIILLSKWRMFAVKPRHWPANLRANAVDLIVGLSFLIFMIHSDSQAWQGLWALLYAAWLLWLKPQSSVFGNTLQALLGQLLGLVAMFIMWGGQSPLVLVLLSWAVCYATARHFFANFEDSMVRFLSYIWAFIAASLAWVTSHWLIFYGPVSQPALLLTVISFGLGSAYYLQKADRLTLGIRRQIMFVTITVVLIILWFSQWGDKTV